jgi:quercetin dioxygenase-like cupin family protein
MNRNRAIWIVVLLGCAVALAAQERVQRSSSTIYKHVLPAMDGGRLRAELVEVVYGPGGASPVHSHSCPVIAYVLQGSLRMQVKGGPEAVYKEGEAFYEAPNGVHLVSANASDRVPAKFLAIFVCDRENAE